MGDAYNDDPDVPKDGDPYIPEDIQGGARAQIIRLDRRVRELEDENEALIEIAGEQLLLYYGLQGKYRKALKEVRDTEEGTDE